MILCIETATPVCSAALCDHNKIVNVLVAEQGLSHASQLTVLIGELLETAGVAPLSLEAVAVSKGPGSYTGLRIGVSVAKGIAYGAGIPLIGINTLAAMCHGYLAVNTLPEGDTTLLCPMIDARRMEVYNALFTAKGVMVRETSADIITEKSFSAELESGKVIFFGSGAEKCREVITGRNAHFEDDFALTASYLHIPSVRALREKHFEDVAYFEPYYLKEFIATVPRKLIP
ncbi:MAG: tRNA (adenosine(37)-N6)-threonylcarbamoyltransferase complex dimerization subunit type 1 TsaB [Bacteroidales bacterium]|jgi:tRNA threonylcarbamoyladenosine biosynthesis protein TsaB|nr:tRNA (adenosine(37)-N6)-threonylcarbamoyltransferase complex dimerization subunit type 1 TsaB [Bacteroidales bacterium]